MSPIASYVQTTTYDLTPPYYRLPPIVWSIFTAFNQVHSIWRWYRRVELYRKPDNLFQLFTGHVVNITIGDSLLLRVAAQSLLVATRLLECTQQQRLVKDAARECYGTLCGYYPKPNSIRWEEQRSPLGLSASTVFFCKMTLCKIYERMKRIALSVYEVAKELFTLSMTILDVIDAFCWSPAIKNDAINEGFVNLTKWLEQLVDHKDTLLTGLKENKATIEYLLQSTPFTYEQLCNAATNTLETSQVIHSCVKKISTVGGNTLLDIGTRILNGGMIVIGLADYAPFNPGNNIATGSIG